MKLLILILILTGCATTSVTKLKSYKPKSENCKIEFFSQKPNRDFEEIALLHARGGQSIFEGKSVNSLLPDLKKKACTAGGDAIIITNSKEGGFNIKGPSDRAIVSATVIKFMK